GVAEALGISVGRADVSLSVHRVVGTPIAHGAALVAHREARVVRQRIARHVAAVAPAVNADARPVHVRLLLEPRQSIFDITQLQLAEIAIDLPCRYCALAARGPVIANPDDDAFLREELVIHSLA